MLSALVAMPSAHVHTTQPSLSAGWCAICSSLLDWRVVLADHLLLEKE
jgi:hypothetical protein